MSHNESNAFWKELWSSDNEKGFIQEEPNQFLIKYFEKFNLSQGSNCFVPLCGESIDMNFLLSKGMNVIGVELSEKGAEHFFQKNKLDYTLTQTPDGHPVYQAEHIQIIIADILTVTPQTLGIEIHFWYDRGGYIALPLSVRKDYAQKMHELCQDKIKVLLITTIHNGSQDGPPYSISEQEMIENFAQGPKFHTLEIHKRTDMPERHLKVGRTEQTFTIYQANN